MNVIPIKNYQTTNLKPSFKAHLPEQTLQRINLNLKRCLNQKQIDEFNKEFEKLMPKIKEIKFNREKEVTITAGTLCNKQPSPNGFYIALTEKAANRLIPYSRDNYFNITARCENNVGEAWLDTEEAFLVKADIKVRTELDDMLVDNEPENYSSAIGKTIAKRLYDTIKLATNNIEEDPAQIKKRKNAERLALIF